jgi:cobalamin biosynthesis protein CbiG
MKTQNDDAVQGADELRPHYNFDYSKAKPNRFAGRLGEEAIAVVLDPDVAAVFTTSEEANQALRVLIDALGNLAAVPDLLEKVKSSTAAAAAPQS